MRYIMVLVLLAVSIAAFAQDPNASPQVGNAERGRAMISVLGPTGRDFSRMTLEQQLDYGRKLRCDEVRQKIQEQLDYEAAGSSGYYDMSNLRTVEKDICTLLRRIAKPSSRGNHDGDLVALRARYIALMTQVANSNWTPVGVPIGVHCMVRFTQIPGGDVSAIEYLNCPFDPAARGTIESAMHKEPMPYTGFARVFIRQVTIDFCHPAQICIRHTEPMTVEQSTPFPVTDAPPQYPREAIEYPREALASGASGIVIVHLTIAKNGTVQDAVIGTSSGNMYLDKAALYGVRKWRFKPSKAGRSADVPVTFSLKTTN